MQRLLLLLIPFLLAADWPTYMSDMQRSGIAKEHLAAPLWREWTFHSPHAPHPAWPAPAKRDVTNGQRDLRAVLAYDRAFQTVLADNTVFFGSSADDKVYALDITTGQIRWTFITGGPLRLAPTFDKGKLFVGCDDGYVYCISASNGKLVWKQRVHTPRRMLPGNGRVISAWPVRSSIAIRDDIAYAAAGLFPSEGAYLAAFESQTGRPNWKKKIDISTQGYMLATQQRLYVPTGRTTPAVFDRDQGKLVGKLPGHGGTFSLVVDDVVASGPGVRRKEIRVTDAKTSETIATFGGLAMVVDGRMAYMLSEDSLTALDRSQHLDLARQRNTLSKKKQSLEKSLKKKKSSDKSTQAISAELASIAKRLKEIDSAMKKCVLWKKPCDCPNAMILGGTMLYLGGRDELIAVDTTNGKRTWQAPTDGTVHGLAIGGGRLLATTDKGIIHCFSKTQTERENIVRLEPESLRFANTRIGKADAPIRTEIHADPALNRGYCLLLGCEDSRLVSELVRSSNLQVVCLEPDGKKVSAARRRFDRVGWQGVRVSVIEGSLERMPLPSGFANLIVCGKMPSKRLLPPAAAEVARVLRPCGGRVILTISTSERNAKTPTLEALRAWGQGHFERWEVAQTSHSICARAKRGRLPGSGEWTHTFADAANTACSNDLLVGRDLQVQWFGRPGPNGMVDRHFRNVPPLYQNGRLFIPGRNTIIAVDAYNGTIQWEAVTPDSLRMGGFLDPSNMTVDENYLYLAAEGKCHRFDARNGKRDILANLPPQNGKSAEEWGYIASVSDMLLGSSRSSGTTYHKETRDAELYTQPVWYPNMKMALSHEIFALDRSSGRRRWAYGNSKQPTRLIDNTFTVGDGTLYFLETTLADKVQKDTCRLPMLDIIENGRQQLVALDLASGHVRFKQKLDMNNFQQPIFLNYAQGTLLLSGSKIIGGEKLRTNGLTGVKQHTGKERIHYYYQAFDSKSGKLRWQRDHDTDLAVRGGHGEFNRHPTLIDGIAYAWPYAYHLDSGKQLKGWKFDRRGHGCGNISASQKCMFWRGSNPWMFDLRPGGGAQRINNVTRPGCFINIIPAGGLVMIPEASSGCTCAYPLQMSLVYSASDSN